MKHHRQLLQCVSMRHWGTTQTEAAKLHAEIRMVSNWLAECPEADIRPEGFEPSTLGSEDRCSDPLSYGRMLNQCLEFLQGQPCLTQNSPQGALGHFLVIWNSQSAMRGFSFLRIMWLPV